MNLDALKTAFAKERHAELMIGAGSAILIAALASILDPETLKLLDAPGPISGFPAKVLVWGTVILGGAYFVYKGLNRIDAERAAAKLKCDVLTPTAAQSSPSSPIAIQISHGNTLVTIHIQLEKDNAQ